GPERNLHPHRRPRQPGAGNQCPGPGSPPGGLPRLRHGGHGRPRPGPGYTGHYRDVGTGLVYMQQRYYDPMVGMFLSVDPVTALSNPVGYFNRYRYAADNPYR